MFIENYKKEDFIVMEKEDLVDLIIQYKDNIKELESKLDNSESEISDLEDEIANLEYELEEKNIPFSSQIEESVIDYESLIYILNRDNMLTDELKNELDYILKYHNNLKWVDEI